MENYSNRNLPEELVEEILLRLSVKALSVCKCVCMGWCNLIKSPSFIDRHFRHECNQDCLLFRIYDINLLDDENQYAYAVYKDGECPSRLEEPEHLSQMPNDHRAVDLLGPENGIFYVIGIFRRVGLLNPAMREFKMLPPHPLHDLVRDLPLIGFGLEPSSGDFKVVALVQSSLLNFAFVYNLTSDSWKKIEAVSDVFLPAESVNKCRILNGCKHWLVRFVTRDAFAIISFNMSSEKFEEIPIPDALRNTESRLQLTEYGDARAVMSLIWNTSLDFWAMGSDGLWSLMFRYQHFEENWWPLCAWKENEFFIGSNTVRLIMYDIHTQERRILIPETEAKYVCDYFTYKESLFSIKGEGDAVDSIEDLYMSSSNNGT